MATLEALNAEYAQYTDEFNRLWKEGNKPERLEEMKKRLQELKKQITVAKAADGGAKEAGKKERLLLKTPKGTRDYGPGEMFCREHIERTVKECFILYGGAQLDTPVFERKDILAGKYGEDQKLIFDLEDQGGEQLALRYDHTVPLARYLAMSGGTNTQSKLWQVGKVYRRDNPVMSKGRMREFSQADFDISGQWDTMIPDAEVLSLVCKILTRLEVGDFTVKINHRKILDGIFEVCGVPPARIRPISSAVDKLDKLPWSKVKEEMVVEKGLDEAAADKIGEYVKHKGSRDLLERLLADEQLVVNKSAKAGLDEMVLLFDYLDAYGITGKMSFDMSLARGLDYYTGIIYEAVTEASAPPGLNADATASIPVAPPKPRAKKFVADGEEEIDESTVGVGSIAAGGRYDNLVGLFATAAAGDEKKKAQGLPCVGISIGLDRIFALLWPKWAERGMRTKEVMAFVMSAGDGLLKERMELVQELRDAGISADFLAKRRPKGMNAQFAAGERDEVPFAVIIGGDELKSGIVTVKEQRWQITNGKKTKVESEDKGAQVKRVDLVQHIRSSGVYQLWASGKMIDV
ncbi:histidine-tRNA ligase [Vararia minispora EC-137]|uniref:Histidine-tRNA ligase n=1 Tax=Vararia minispora EC-137 TaxID=1314806 RepID=A0ACB8QCH2_9AGAM|nr:histidine-tRNA ligase [Vararia minispora EC-137]